MNLRLAVWNCNMRLHDKLDGVRFLRPDVLVVPECACPEVLLRRAPDLSVTGILWTGRRAQKGLAVLSFGAWRVAFDRAHDPRGGSSIAARVSGPRELRLAAVWDVPGSPEPLGRAVDRLSRFLKDGPAAIAGDFNDALVRRCRSGRAQPTRLASRIEALGFSSAYHDDRRARLGAEAEPTLYMRRREGFPGHRDLVFLDRRVMRGLRGVTVGSREAWTGASDHAPVVAEIDPGVW